MRVAPAAAIVRRSSRLRMPPDAFTPISGPTVARMSAISCAVAAEVEHPVGIHAHAGEVVLARLAADLGDLGACGVGFEDGVIDEGGDGGIDLGELLTGGDARRAGVEDGAGVFGAGLRAALRASGADLI